MSSDKILVAKEGGIGRLTFNNPERHNAMSLEMWQRTAEILADFDQDPAVRVVVLAGAGGKAFVSGADISKFESERASADAQKIYSDAVAGASTGLRDLSKPTIAQIQGYCLGGGLGLAICADIRICSENSRFAVPAAKLGIGYGHEGIGRLMELVGPSVTKDIFFTARQYTAQQAYNCGLVNHVVPVEELKTFVDDYAATVAGNAPLTIAAVKQSVAELLKDPGERDFALCERKTAAALGSQDFIEGRRAFMEKRKPNFQGR